MVPVYAVSLVMGVALLVPFIVGWRRGPRRDLAGLIVGFGIAGMSASFAGWAPVLAFVAAAVGGLAIATGARLLAPTSDGAEE